MANLKKFLYSAVNLQQDLCHISHHSLNVLLHYLVKYKRSTIAMLLMYLTQYHRVVSKHQHMWLFNDIKCLKCPETFVPLIHCIIDYTLSLAMPDFCRTLLQFTDVVNLMSVANVFMRTSMPKEDILAFTATQQYTYN